MSDVEVKLTGEYASWSVKIPERIKSTAQYIRSTYWRLYRLLLHDAVVFCKVRGIYILHDFDEFLLLVDDGIFEDAD